MGHYGKGGPSKVPLKKRKLRRSQVRRPQPSSRATYADLLTIGALFIALILLVTLGFQWALP